MTLRNAILLLVVAAPLAGQGIPVAPAPSVLFASTSRADASGPALTIDTVTRRKDRREVGAGIGVMAGLAAVYGLGRLDLGSACGTGAGTGCPTPYHPGPGSYLIGGAVGGAVGYVVGRVINGPYHRPATPPPPRPPDTGVKWWQGALIGTAVGSFAVPVLAHGFHLDRGGDGDAPIVLIPVGALIGAFVGAGSAMD